MNGIFRRSRFVFGTSDFTTDVSAKPWTPVDNTIGGSRTSAAGIPASYIVRRDIMVDLTLRIGELEWPTYLSLIAYGQTSQTFLWYPDADETVSYEVYLEAPLAGERWTPARIGDYQRMFECNLTLRNVAGVNPYKPYFEDADDLVTDREIAFVVASPTSITFPVGGTQEITVTALNAAVQAIPGTTTVFTSADPTIATVNPDLGLTAGSSTGSTTVTPVVDGVEGTPIPVTVTAAPAGTVYFDDDFAGGVFAGPQAGFQWGDLSGGAYNPVPSIVADVDAPSGFALRHRFNATSGGSRSESRLLYGSNLTDVYIGYSIKFPLNFFHRNGPSSDNNKMIRVWGNAYGTSEGDGDPGVKIGFDALPSPSTGGGSHFNFSNLSFGRTEGDGHKYTSWSPGGFLGVNLSTDLGMYRRFVVHFTVATGAGLLDGVEEVWIDGLLKWSKKNADLWDYSPVKHNYFDQMYFLGAANSGFNVVTDILITSVLIGSTYSSVA